MSDKIVVKRSGKEEPLDIKKIQKQSSEAVFGFPDVSQSELELDAHIKFKNKTLSTEIQKLLIQTAVDKIDIDRPNWTYVAARLFLFDLYHRVGAIIGETKGERYPLFKTYIENGINEGRLIPTLTKGYDIDDLEKHLKPERDFLFNYLGIKTLYDRYLIKNKKGECIELPQHMFMSIAMFLAQNEKDKQQKAKEFYDVISKFEVMLATPTLSNARKIRSQLSSCYIGSTPDNIEGIFDGYKEMALLSKYGGGIGWDWNQLRSLGGVIDNNISAAGGTVPFLKITNDLAIAVDQLGTRKGSIAVYLEPWHMDIVDFVDLKKNSGEERRRAHDLFPALWISDLFMERVLEDGDWTLFDPYEVKDLSETFGDEFKEKYIAYENNQSIKKNVMKAKDLWKKILTSYFEVGSPFLCWKDTANRANPNSHVGHIRSSNLCTEIFQNTNPNKYLMKIFLSEHDDDFLTFEETDLLMLEDGIYKNAKDINSLDTLRGKVVGIQDENSYVVELFQNLLPVYTVEKHKVDGDTAVCNLASINLSKINTKEDIERVVPIAIRMLDNVIDLNYYPLKKVKNTNMKSRAIGLGVMGEAQMLAEKQIHFGTQEHLELIDNIMETVSFNAIKSSSALGEEKGNYPQFEGSNWQNGIYPQNNVNRDVHELTSGNGVYSEEDYVNLRKSTKEYMRNGYLMAIAPTSSISILVGTTQAIEPVYKRKWYEENLLGLIPVVVPNLSPDTWEYYKPAFEIDQLQVIKAAAVRQKWIDQGQSTNIFMSLEKASGKHLHEIYTLAWKLGLKSTYYLRSQSPEAKKAEMEMSNDVVDRSLECAGCQ